MGAHAGGARGKEETRVTRSSRLAVALLPFTMLAFISGAAWADDSEAFFAQGRSLRLEKKCAEAIPLFRKALDARPSGIGALRNVAECEEEIGHFASARADFWRLRAAALETNDQKYAGWDAYAETRYKNLEQKVPKMTVRLSGVGLDLVRVTIDGQPLHPDLVGTELERDPGTHVIEASYGGAAPLRVEKTLAPGAREVVTVVIPGDPRTLVANADAGKASRGPSPLRTAGFVVLGVGVASGVGLAIAAVIRASAQSTVDQSCPGTMCPTMADQMNANDAISRGKAASTALDVLIPLTVAGVGAGVTLITIGSLAKPSAPAPTAGVSGVEIGVAPSIAGAALRIGGRF